MIKKLQFMTVVAIVLFIFSELNAQLKVDFGRRDPASELESGWQAYIANHEEEADFSMQNFTAFGGEVIVEPKWHASSPNVVKQMMYRDSDDPNHWNYCYYTGSDVNLIIDWIGTDGRVKEDDYQDTTFTLNLYGIPEGTYKLTSFHHDGNGQHGLMAIKVSNVAGVISEDTLRITQSLYTDSVTTAVCCSPDSVAKYTDTITSGGTNDIITLSFELIDGVGDNDRFIVINGFTLDQLEGETNLVKNELYNQFKIINNSFSNYTIKTGLQEEVKLNVYNITGSEVLSTTFINSVNINKEQLGSSGIYIVQLTHNNRTTTRKISIY